MQRPVVADKTNKIPRITEMYIPQLKKKANIREIPKIERVNLSRLEISTNTIYTPNLKGHQLEIS